jgi:hypothetical protein
LKAEASVQERVWKWLVRNNCRSFLSASIFSEVRHKTLVEVRDVFAAELLKQTLVSYGKVDRLLLTKGLANQTEADSFAPLSRACVFASGQTSVGYSPCSDRI